MQFSFLKPHFWHPPNFAKTLFWHSVTLFVFSKIPKKHYKNGEKQWKKNLDQFLTLDLDQFLTLETPNLGPVFNSNLRGTNWAKSFSHYKNRGFRRFLVLSYHFVLFSCVQLFANSLKIAFLENRVQKLGFSNFSVLSSFFENSLFC